MTEVKRNLLMGSIYIYVPQQIDSRMEVRERSKEDKSYTK